MLSQTHTINRQIFEMHVADQAAARKTRHQAERLNQTGVLPLLEKTLNTFAVPEKVLWIDRLEIDLVISSPEQFEEEFIPKLELRLSEIFNDLYQAMEQPCPTDRGVEARRGLIGRRVPSRGLAMHGQEHHPALDAFKALPAGRILSTSGAGKELVAHFLTTGLLPWWAEPATAGQMESILVKSVQSAPQEDHVWIADLLAAKNSRQRLVYQFSDTALAQVAVLFSSDAVDSVWSMAGTLIKAVRRLSKGRASVDMVREVVWEQIFIVLSVQKMHSASIQRIFPALITRTAASFQLSVADFMDALKRLAAEQIDNDQRPQTYLIEWIEAHGQALGNPIAKDQKSAAEQIQAIHTNEPTVDKGLALFLKQPAIGDSIPKGEMAFFEQSKDIDSPVKEQIVQGVPVENAGLVLLWPFLGHFFKQLNLVGDNGLVDQTAAFRAVILMQYLATGQSQTAEPYLVLNKVLCGLDPETPVPCSIRLTSTEKKESRQMLEAVIQRWAALKNTSVQGMQSSFLQRFGLFYATEHNWLLRVERKVFDLLLDRLPWGIGTIKLSWMDRFLAVEW